MLYFPKRRSILFIPAIFIVLLSLAAPYIPHTFTLVDEPTPQFSYPALSGEVVELSALRGEVVFLNFWATWCPSCVDELPHLDALQRRFKGKLKVISVGGFRESAARLKSFLKRRPVTYPVVHLEEADLDRVVTSFGQFYQIPQTFAIDKRGRVRQVWSERREAEELIRVAQLLVDEE